MSLTRTRQRTTVRRRTEPDSRHSLVRLRGGDCVAHSGADGGGLVQLVRQLKKLHWILQTRGHAGPDDSGWDGQPVGR